MLIKESFLLALSSIRMNKMRSFLTMLGIIIGIGSVIGISSIGTTIKASFTKEFEAFGLNGIDIYINWENGEQEETAYFKAEEDFPALRQKFGDKIVYMAPPSGEGTTSEIKINSKSYKLSLNGVDVGYLSTVPNMVMVKGRMINEEDIEKQKDVIVIDKDFAMEVSGTTDVIGQRINVTLDGNLKEMTIVGVYEFKISAFARQMGAGRNGQTKISFVPYTLYGSSWTTTYISMYINRDYDIEKVQAEIEKFLYEMKEQKEGTYKVYSAQKEANQINEILGTLSLGIGAIAAISLLVGGIGIMNIMLVSVTERTREIGIRKSLGAKTGNILFQFLIEASILSLIGGIIGILLGLGIGRVGAYFVKTSMVIDPMTIIGAVIFSSLVGLFFGLYPARKAAKLDPIEALRYE